MNLLSFRTSKVISLVMLTAVLAPARLMACAVCYGESDAPMARGVTWGILALAGVIGCVLSGVVVFFVHVKRTSSALEKPDAAAESDQRNV